MEDHQVKNLQFEGIHETGTIMLWDAGVWQLHPESEDTGSCLSRGILRFILNGEKLKGGWVLVRTDQRRNGRPIWHFTKDTENATSDLDDLLNEHPDSVLDGRSKARIEEDWNGGKADTSEQMGLF